MDSEVFAWVAIVILICLSGTFSGLTLGLLSLDLIGLEIVIGSGSELEGRYARRIYPLRKRGNLLLCTLLLGNVAVNALISILLADKTSGFWGFLISTVVIVVFGEITPQSICQRHGLMIGYYTVWMVWIFLIFLFPAAYPISLCLDRLLGQELGTIYTRSELKKLLDIHSSVTQSDLTRAETKVLAGALDFGVKEVGDIMTPIEQVFMLGIDETLTHEQIKDIVQTGYSRIPIYEGNHHHITGMLFAKDLALLNPDHTFVIRNILPTLNRQLPRVFADTPLSDMLAEFKTGSAHMALVRTVNSEGPGDPVYENVGVVTLEDIFEEIIGDDIDDEIDSAIAKRKGKLIRATHGAPTPQKENNALEVSNETILSLCKYLMANVRSFKKKRMSKAVLKRLLAQSPIAIVETATMSEDKVPFLFLEGHLVSYFAVLLSGKVTILQGGLEIDKISSKEGSGEFGCFIEDALRVPRYRPNFSAKPQGYVRYLKISKESYDAAIEASKLERKHKSIIREAAGLFGMDQAEVTIDLPLGKEKEKEKEEKEEKELADLSSSSPYTSAASATFDGGRRGVGRGDWGGGGEFTVTTEGPIDRVTGSEGFGGGFGSDNVQ